MALSSYSSRLGEGAGTELVSKAGSKQILLARPSLDVFLEKSKLAHLVVINAPAGYGKSTLLKHWIESYSNTEGFVVCISFNEAYNNPLKLIAVIAKLVSSVTDSFDSSVSSLVDVYEGGDPDDTALSALVDRLVGGLSNIVEPGAIFVDDFQKVDNPFVHQIINKIIRHLPVSVRFLVASRGTPSLPLAKFRAKGKLLEIGVEELRLEVGESEKLLNDVYQLSLPLDLISVLYDKTEGWISGLSLAAAAMPVGQRERAEFVRLFSGSSALVSHYFFEQVLLQLPAEMQTLFKKISVADKVCGDLVNTLAGRNDGQEVLERLEHQQLFVFPLDRQRKWYKMAPLLAECLRTRLVQDSENAAEHLHFSASLWFTNHGMHEEAVHHALMSKDVEMAASLISECGNDLISNGRMYELFQWSQLIPEQEDVRYPILSLLSAWRYAWAQEFDEAEQLVEKVVQHIAQGLTSENQLLTSDDYASAIAVKTFVTLQKDELSACVALAQEWLSKFDGVNPFLLSMISIMASLAHIVQGEPVPAKRMLHISQRFNAGLEGKYLIVLINAVQTLYELEAGMIKEAASHQKLSLECSKDLLHPSSGEPITIPHVTCGMVRYELNELDGLDEWFEKACESSQLIMPMELYALSYIYLARLRFLHGKADDAVRVLSELRSMAEGKGYQRITIMAVSELVTVLLSFDDLVTAKQLVIEYGLDKVTVPLEGFSNSFWFASLAVAHIHFHAGEYDAALNKITVLEATLVPSWHDYRRLKLLLFKSKVLYRAGDMGNGLESLRVALVVAEAEQYMRSFLDEGLLMCAMLKRLLADKLVLDDSTKSYVQKLISNFEVISNIQEEKESSGPSGDNSANLLTNRERQVLSLAAAGNTNLQIGEKTYLSLGTVKWHLHNVYGKLNVRNRTHAIKKARELGAI